MNGEKSGDWLDFRREAESGIESVSAHFTGHAYDPHDHDEVLVGFTQQGVQRFRCHRALHTSSPGRAILIEPGAVHDGHAPDTDGFTYSMLYLPQAWVSTQLAQRGLADISLIEAAFRHTLTDDVTLFCAIQQTFFAFHHQEGKLARDQSMDRLLSLLTRHIKVASPSQKSDTLLHMQRIREILHERMAEDIGLDELSRLAGIDRFRLSRQFSKAFGQTPHAYLVRLRLRSARALLAHGQEPAQVAAQVGFADQSHLGRWFQRAYRMSPAAFQQQCTNVLSR
ncbi:AraC family transcriptional regulator [Superficieibacter sp. 1612_C1]|uniref:AraC family transcriptional regulator n=1 Tax=Superficieibacter sp. 1612_C1 TaxID=2780382 RepID=UPI0018841B8B|nr:AraC family transcriptional regulator [Superficieibacter sp. 1612_C1]